MRSVVPYMTLRDGSSGTPGLGPGMRQTSWMARPSRTQPKWIEPVALRVVPSGSKARTSIAQSPTKRP